jgi:archaellum biogenesis protein FlaJ (TadC family)
VSRAIGRRAGSIRRLDQALYALFSRHADRSRHERDRNRFRAADLRVSFEVYLSRVYGMSALAFLGVAAGTFVGLVGLPGTTVSTVVSVVHAGVPLVERLPAPAVPRTWTAGIVAVVAGGVAKRTTIVAGGRYLAYRARARRADIERTLPGAVRYLRALTAGTDDQRTLLRKVADNPDAYGETAVEMRRVLDKAALAGSVREGLRMVARDTPSRELLAPFLLKFREHAEQGPDELANYLRMESRVLGHRRARARERAGSYLELVAELFVVLLVLPALLVIVVTVMGVLAPGLDSTVTTPVGAATVRAVILYGSAAFILAVGAVAALVVESLRPAGIATPTYERPAGLETVRTAFRNPASTAVVALPVGAAAAAALVWFAYDPLNVGLLAYATYGTLVGTVAVRRARRDDARDREIIDVVHAVSGHVSLGRPFPEAVEIVAREVDLGPLQPAVADLAFNARLTTGQSDETDRRTAALERFVDEVGTPLAEQTMGLVTGALAVGSDSDEVFETLQSEIGRLHHEKRALRSNMAVYVAVGWTAALLLVGIMVAVNVYVLEGFAQLGSVSGSMANSTLDPGAVQPERDRYRFYVVTQATMLACGWFAGTASRGRYAALLHSGALVAVAYFVFAGVGLL